MTDSDRGRNIDRGHVHVWWAWLDQPGWRVQQLAHTLSADECERAGRFHFQVDRDRFVVGRGLLRSILGHYLHLEPGQVRFGYSPQGKPYLRRPPDWADVRFNVAHSHQLAVYAFTVTREIGVDLEYMRPMPLLLQMAARFFSARENAILSGLPQDRQLDAFYRCWTCKEAYLKARGVGLGQPLDSFDVSLAPVEPARLLHVDGAPQEPDRWALQSLVPAPGYAAALAVEGRGWYLTVWNAPRDLGPLGNDGIMARSW